VTSSSPHSRAERLRVTRQRAAEPALADLRLRISRYILGVVRDPTEAEDLTQETFLRAHRQRGSLRDPDAALAWLYSIATRACLDRLRARARGTSRESGLDPETLSGPDPAASAQERLEREEMSACVQGYVGALSDGYRAVLLLHDVHGLTSPEIAELLGDSVGSVKIRLHRARERLRRALAAGCTFSHDECGTLVCDPRP
jgi:RNA polymerase sigma-70 factor, ECF subfamily